MCRVLLFRRCLYCLHPQKYAGVGSHAFSVCELPLSLSPTLLACMRLCGFSLCGCVCLSRQALITVFCVFSF